MAAEESAKVSGRARIELNFHFCDEHRKSLRVQDILTDESWEHMKKEFSKIGKIMPDRKTIELDFLHIRWGYYN